MSSMRAILPGRLAHVSKLCPETLQNVSVAIETQEYAARRERLSGLLDERGLDAIFVPPSSDLEYLTGLERDLPSFGHLSYAHGWVAGAFLAPGREPLFVLPRMVVDFHLGGEPPPGAVVVHEDADSRVLFAEAARSLGAPGRLAGAGCPPFPTQIFPWGGRRLDSGAAAAAEPLADGEAVLFDFGAVVEGY